MVLENPYAHSLDGLEIEDPVHSFFDYCKKREAVRVKRSKTLNEKTLCVWI